jgi:hypothetical protein
MVRSKGNVIVKDKGMITIEDESKPSMLYTSKFPSQNELEYG